MSETMFLPLSGNIHTTFAATVFNDKFQQFFLHFGEQFKHDLSQTMFVPKTDSFEQYFIPKQVVNVAMKV